MQERRRLPRWQFESSLLYKALEKETSESPGFLQDINLVGTKVYLKTQVAVQSKIRLEIKIPNQESPILVEGEVLWQNSPKTMGFPTGIRFTFFKPQDKEKILEYFDSQIRQNWWREFKSSL